MSRTRENIKKTLKTPAPPQPATLLAWYDKMGRDLPWRSHDGRAASPYHTWIAEIMLQQTTVAAVMPYFARFTARWPSVAALAKADEQKVLAEWAGLGYYSRARNLLRCAQIVAAQHKGVFPDEIAALKTLPGIGDYTANAIRAIAFDKPANVVDGNVERVMARIFAYDKNLTQPRAKAELKEWAGELTPSKRPGDYAQALMDLGATICTPRAPKCLLCPWRGNCRAYALGRQEEFPYKIKKKDQTVRFGASRAIIRKDGAFYLVQRPATGLLGGLWECPSTAWHKQTAPSHAMLAQELGITDADWIEQPVVHVFTHFKLITQVAIGVQAKIPTPFRNKGKWFLPHELPPLSTLTKKIMAAALKYSGTSDKNG